jgi:uncharacterized protein (TIGR02246 family)
VGSPLRRSFPALAALLLALSASWSAPAEDAASSIRARLDADAAAWNRGDLEAFCAAYVEDAVFVTPHGITHGRQAVLDRYRAKYKDHAGMGSLKLEVLETRELVPEKAASAVARWTLTWPDKPEATGFTMLVFRRSSDGWRIVQDASM